jgi:hypothetical protein
MGIFSRGRVIQGTGLELRRTPAYAWFAGYMGSFVWVGGGTRRASGAAGRVVLGVLRPELLMWWGERGHTAGLL